MQPWRLSAVRAPVAALAALALLPGVAAPGASGAQDEIDNELDRFMERVLAQRERNAAARLQYVLDEESRIRLTGPDGDVLWGSAANTPGTMRQPFEGIWLPERIDMRAAVSLAIGAFELSGTRAYTNYREATTGGRIRAIRPELPR